MCWLVVVHNNSFFQGHVIVIFGTSQQLLQQLLVRPAGSSASPDGAAGHHYLNSVQCLALGFQYFHIVQLRNIIKDCFKNLKLVRVLYLHRRLRIQDITVQARDPLRI